MERVFAGQGMLERLERFQHPPRAKINKYKNIILALIKNLLYSNVFIIIDYIYRK